MAKVTQNIDQNNYQNQLPTSGRWIWKDDGLEFVSNSTNTDKLDKRRKTKTGQHLDAGNKRNESMMRGMGRMRKSRSSHVKSPRLGIKQTGEHTTVTLADIKSVAYDMLNEVDDLPSSFIGLFPTEQFDRFIQYLLSYFHCFFDKMAQENKKNPMFIEPSIAEQKAYANACVRMEVAQKFLGQSYCILVLGLGLGNQHHMGCGQSRVSSTYKDRDMYETLYSFCAFVVWITFRRKEDFETIKKEIGRMLRSDTFNPAIRVKNAPEETKEEIEDEEKTEKKENEKVEPKIPEKITPAEYRRLHPKRPAIKSMVTQRSPAVVSILPSPKEEAHWLFKTKGTGPELIAKHGQNNEDDDQTIEMFNELIIDDKSFKVGIVGEPLSQFNSVTLTPLGADNDDEDQEDGEKGPGDDHGDKVTQADHSGVSRQQTTVSTITVDGLADED